MKKLIPFLCVFAYYASPYRLAGHVMPEFICLLAAIAQFAITTKLCLPKEYVLFMAYMWLIPPVASLVVGLPGLTIQSLLPLGLILTSINLAVLLPNVDSDLVIKYYRWLVYLAIVFFIVQELSSVLIGFRPTLYLNFLESYYDDASMMDFVSSRSEMERSSSFFLEPSHFIQYILPYVCIVISQCIRKKRISKELILLLVIVVWSKTGAGLFVLAVMCLFSILFYGKYGVITKVFLLVVLTTFLIIAFTFFSDNIFVAEIMRRLSEFSPTVDPYGQQSGFFRIWRGYFIYASEDIVNQIFGTTTTAVEYIASKVVIFGVNYEGTYMNGIQSLLVLGGIVGTVLFFLYVRRIYKEFTLSGRCILVAMIALFFIENMLFSPKMFLFILVAYCISKVEQKNESRYIKLNNE